MGKKMIYGLLALMSPVGIVIAVFLLIVVIIFAAAGSTVGWIFGGAAPNKIPSALKPPGGAINLWTPTPVPSDCYVTPTPVAVTATPGPALTPAATLAPDETPSATATAQTVYLPTATPCPLEYFATPDPNYPPIGAGAGGAFDVRQGQITAAKVSQILSKYPQYPLGGNGMPLPGSAPIGPNPLTPYAAQVVEFGAKYGLNGGYALAFFVMESGLCTTGISPTAIECGNIIWTSGGNCVTRNQVGPRNFCGYASWPDALEAWFRLIKGEYITSGLNTVEAIVNTYAPCSDNGGCGFVNNYIANVQGLITQWGVGGVDPSTRMDTEPHGSPYKTGNNGYWVTQPYGCTDFEEFEDQYCRNSTGGAARWFHRGVDIVSKGNKTVFATISGVVQFAGGLGQGGFGARVYIKQGPYLVIYPHLSTILVGVGQEVKWGQPIGIEGSTGYSTGSHLHYEVHINGAWVDSTPYLMRP